MGSGETVEEVKEIVKGVAAVAGVAMVAAVAGVAMVGWGLSKILGSRKKMKFEDDPATYFHEGNNTETEVKDKTVEEVKEIVKGVAAVAGVVMVGWGLSKILGSDERKKMKAPGKPNAYIYRDKFEDDPATYFRNLRSK